MLSLHVMFVFVLIAILMNKNIDKLCTWHAYHVHQTLHVRSAMWYNFFAPPDCKTSQQLNWEFFFLVNWKRLLDHFYFKTWNRRGSSLIFSKKKERIRASRREINHWKVFLLLSKLCKSKATGLDKISARLLHESADLIANSFCSIFNRSIIKFRCVSRWVEML